MVTHWFIMSSLNCKTFTALMCPARSPWVLMIVWVDVHIASLCCSYSFPRLFAKRTTIKPIELHHVLHQCTRWEVTRNTDGDSMN